MTDTALTLPQGASAASGSSAPATAIHAIGTAVPGPRYSQSAMADFMRRALRASPGLNRRLGALYEHSRIETRHSVLGDFAFDPGKSSFLPADWTRDAGPSTAERMAIYAKAAPLLAARAAREALDSAPGIEPHQVTHLIVVSCTGFAAPGIDVALTESLGLNRGVARTQIGFQGCHAGLTALRVADAMCRADPDAWVLIVCVELCSIHFQTTPTDDNLLANALFADGAAAALLHAGRDVATLSRSGDSTGRSGALVAGESRLTPSAESRRVLRIVRSGAWLERDTESEMVWSIGDRGFEMRLSTLVPRLLGHEIGKFLERQLSIDRDGVKRIGSWAVHPGGPAILDRIERSLGLPDDALRASRAVLRHQGNMSSPTIFFVLDRLMREPCSVGDGVALAFGPGLTIEGVHFEVT